MKISIWSLVSVLFFVLPVFASVPHPTAPAPTSAIPTQWLLHEGVVRGGSADSYMSLLDVRRSYSKQAKTERLIFDWGGRVLGPVPKGGYYQVEYRKASGKIPAHIIVSLGLTINSKLEKKQLNAKVKDGLFIRQASLDFDSLSQAENLTFELKKPVRIRVMSYPGREKPLSPAHLVVDLVE